MRCQNMVDRLRKRQWLHRQDVVHDRVGIFPGFSVRFNDWWPHGPRVRVYPAGVSSDLERPILTLDGDVSRREVEIAIAAWKEGHEQGLREGAERIRRGMRDLLEVEAA